VHVTIPEKRRVTRQPGIWIHRSRRVGELALGKGSPPRTSVAETLLDLSDDTADFDEVYGKICDAISDKRTTVAELHAAIAARPRLTWRTELLPMIAAVLAGDQSVLERRYTRDVERRHGLPESERQAGFVTPDGREGRRDRLYRDYGLIVELDGRLGHTGSAVSKDRARDRAAAVAGQQTIRFGWDEVRFQPCDAATEVGRVLRIRGWRGVPAPCGPLCRGRRGLAALAAVVAGLG
jgi:hypothetical protein